MQASITVPADPQLQYLLRIGDTCLILGQRLGEWCGHAPILEEDIALANMALDLIGQARGVLTRAGEQCPQDYDEDQLAFLREERDYVNVTLAELPRGDFAFTVLRNLLLSTWLKLLWQRLQASSDHELAAIAAKALKEARYHQQHAADWLVRLGDGSEESRRRVEAALAALWPYTAELFEADAVDAAAAAAKLGPARSELSEPWLAEIGAVFGEVHLALPGDSAFRSSGSRGMHSEHMGYILAEMQYLQRSFPGGAW
ncbi:MAG TPA: phenylacetate-CoA oxygenase subunit PaaC [Rubrivivax sp.]|nr:phenylacetate-CoA oxygenase subunit PaaC [Rubrivivax sp.]